MIWANFCNVWSLIHKKYLVLFIILQQGCHCPVDDEPQEHTEPRVAEAHGKDKEQYTEESAAAPAKESACDSFYELN